MTQNVNNARLDFPEVLTFKCLRAGIALDLGNSTDKTSLPFSELKKRQ